MTDNRRVRWGILGGARINERMLPAICEANNGSLAAVASRRPGAAAATLETHGRGVARSSVATLDSLDELIRAENVDAIYVPVANNEHVNWALKVLAAGKHVLVEKPIALSVADVDKLAAAAKAANKICMVC